MYKKTLKMMSILAMLCMAFATVSCGGDDDGSTGSSSSQSGGGNSGNGGGNGGGSAAAVTYRYTLDATGLTTDNFRFYDYQLVATTDEGDVKTKTISEPSSIEALTTTSAAVNIQLVVRHKDDFYSLIDDDATYTLAEAGVTKLIISRSDSEKRDTILFNAFGTQSYTREGSFFRYNILHFECTIGYSNYPEARIDCTEIPEVVEYSKVTLYEYKLDATCLTADNFRFYDFTVTTTSTAYPETTVSLTEPKQITLLKAPSDLIQVTIVAQPKSNYASLIDSKTTYQLAEPTMIKLIMEDSDGTSMSFAKGGSVITGKGKYFLANIQHFANRIVYWYSSTKGTIEGFSDVVPDLVDVEPDLEVTEGDMIDLGLSVKWASKNVGDEINTFFAWGEVKSKNSYSWSDYTWYNGSGFTKYNSNFTGTKDYKTMLEAADDAVTQLQNKNWRLPTHAEAQELMNKCTWTWATYDGYEGYHIVGPNGNSIFQPAAGFMEDNTRLLYGLAKGRNTHGYYWLKDIDPNANNSGAWFVYFVKTDRQVRNDGPRKYGLKCRGVMDK